MLLAQNTLADRNLLLGLGCRFTHAVGANLRPRVGPATSTYDGQPIDLVVSCYCSSSGAHYAKSQAEKPGQASLRLLLIGLLDCENSTVPDRTDIAACGHDGRVISRAWKSVYLRQVKMGTCMHLYPMYVMYVMYRRG